MGGGGEVSAGEGGGGDLGGKAGGGGLKLPPNTGSCQLPGLANWLYLMFVDEAVVCINGRGQKFF